MNQKVTIGLLGISALIAAGIVLTALILSWSVAILVWLAVLAVLVVAAFLVPIRFDGLGGTPAPTRDFADAEARFEVDVAANNIPLNPLCHDVLLSHGARTRKVVVLIHGISSCPRAFIGFAPLLHARGHNVLVPRMPYNGYADRNTDALRHLTAGGLCKFGDQIVDIAAGLGDEVIVCGISAGGTVAGWLAQNRADVARAVLIAPFLGLPGLGYRINLLVTRLFLLLPEMSLWKDPLRRRRFEGMPHAYKRQSSRGTAEVLRLGFVTARQAERHRPAALSAALVTNANDGAVDNSLAVSLADRWSVAGMPILRHTFARSHHLGHEIIDPQEPGSDTDLTYPVLVEMIERPVSGAG